MRKALLWVHLVGGLTAAVFLLLLGVTGALMVFEDQIDHAINRKLWHVQPSGQALSLDEIGSRLEKQYPGTKAVAFGLPADPDLAMVVDLAKGREVTEYWVDPCTAQVKGTEADDNTLMQKVHGLHTHMLNRTLGEIVQPIAAGLLLLLALSGIVLWWPRKRWLPKSGASAQIFNFDLHNAMGISSSLFMLLFAITGLAIHFEDGVRKAADKIDHVQQQAPPKAPTHEAGGATLAPERLLAIARAQVPNAIATELDLPMRPGQSARVAMKHEEDHTPAGRSLVFLDAVDGAVLQVRDSRAFGAATKYSRMWNREIHTGDIFGWPTRILAAAFSLALPVLAITGPLIWWDKRRKSAARAVLVT